jgi:hypothetical protein
MADCIILEDILVTVVVEGFNSDEFKSGGLREKQAVNAWNGNDLNISLKTEENQDNLCGDVRSQDLPGAHKASS